MFPIMDLSVPQSMSQPERARALAAHLNTLPNVQPGAMAIALKIGRKLYYGAVYRNADDTSTNPHYHTADCFYLLGKCPQFIREGVAFTVTSQYGDLMPYEAYIAAWCTQAVADDPRFAVYHPFGAHFQIHYWSFDNSRIDDYARYAPYPRIPVQVISLAELE